MRRVSNVFEIIFYLLVDRLDRLYFFTTFAYFFETDVAAAGAAAATSSNAETAVYTAIVYHCRCSHIDISMRFIHLIVVDKLTWLSCTYSSILLTFCACGDLQQQQQQQQRWRNSLKSLGDVRMLHTVMVRTLAFPPTLPGVAVVCWTYRLYRLTKDLVYYCWVSIDGTAVLSPHVPYYIHTYIQPGIPGKYLAALQQYKENGSLLFKM